MLCAVAILGVYTYQSPYVVAANPPSLLPFYDYNGYPTEVTVSDPENQGKTLRLVQTVRQAPGYSSELPLITVQYEIEGTTFGRVYHIAPNQNQGYDVKEIVTITEGQQPQYIVPPRGTPIAPPTQTNQNVTPTPPTNSTNQTNTQQVTPPRTNQNVTNVQPLQASNAGTNQKGYEPLASIKGLTSNGSAAKDFQSTLNFIFKWGIAVAVLLSVFMTILGGIQYMTTDAYSGKQDGIEKLQAAIAGLLLALSAWLILYTVNPRILKPSESELLK